MGEDGSAPSLHEFMSWNRERILAAAREKMRIRSPHDSDDALLHGPDVVPGLVTALRETLAP